MKGFASSLSDEDMKDNRRLLATTKAGAGRLARSKDLAALGEKIWRGGSSRHIAACAGYLRPNGLRHPPVPASGGPTAEYTEAQLKAFRAGTRACPPQMTGIAAEMTDKEIAAVSDYVAGLR